jgi:hypothetical protein
MFAVGAETLVRPYPELLRRYIETFYIRYRVMSDKALNEQTVKALRAGMGRKDQQRAKLEKVQKIRQALEELSLARRRLAEACDPA